MCVQVSGLGSVYRKFWPGGCIHLGFWPKVFYLGGGLFFEVHFDGCLRVSYVLFVFQMLSVVGMSYINWWGTWNKIARLAKVSYVIALF